MRDIQTREYRNVAGQFNAMAVCSTCNRDALQVRMSRTCIQAMDGLPFVCDECCEKQSQRENNNGGDHA